MFNLDLNLSGFRLKQSGEKWLVFDPLRKRYITLTPEERVRQAFVASLLREFHYPAGRMGNEISIQRFQRNFRCDTIIYDNVGDPLVIVEYKAPSVAITQQVFNQAVNYNATLRVRYLFVTNGLSFYGCYFDYETMQSHFLTEIPSYQQLVGEE